MDFQKEIAVTKAKILVLRSHWCYNGKITAKRKKQFFKYMNYWVETWLGRCPVTSIYQPPPPPPPPPPPENPPPPLPEPEDAGGVDAEDMV